MTTVNEILKKINKDHGPSIAALGSAKPANVIRIPTGIFAVDLAMGGGFPMGKCSIVYGPESSNKTNIVLLTIASAQRMYPEHKVVFVDAEHAFDMAWAEKMGVDAERIIVVQPEHAEQAADLIEAFQYAEDVCMIALDSIAALATQKEIENSVETMAVGGASLTVGRLYRKVTVAGNRIANQGKTPPAFIAINQIRTKIGVMFGNPETMPGGNPPKFASSMTLRVYGKNVMDKKISTVMPAYKEVNCVIQKWKCPILAINATYTMQMVEGAGRPVGFISDWNTVSSYMKELDYLSKAEKGGWVMNGEIYPTLEACRDTLYGDIHMLADMKQTIIQELVDKGQGLEESTGELPVEESA